MSDPQKRENGRRVLEFLEKKQTATNTLLAKEFSLEEGEINKLLNELRRDGLVLFQQELHLTRGELIMAKITSRGSAALLLMKSEKPSQGGVYDLDRISRAVSFAARAHKDEFRKGSSVPYIVHPLDVLSVLLKNGASEDLAIAGVLHDVLEDTPVTREDIRKNFGGTVVRLVEAASESEKLTRGIPNDQKKKTWKLRKTERIEKTKNSGRELRLLFCADKLANIRDLICDVREEGDGVWSKFNASREDEEWYYREMASALISGQEKSSIAGTSAYVELVDCIRQVFGSS